MCGLAGIWAPNLPRDAAALVSRMANAISHRGPDDVGTTVDEGAGLAFGFRRLAIIDLSAAGHQPMTSASGRFVMVFNGEIYNFLELRRQLQGAGVQFSGGSDTEVILAAAEQWGPQDLWHRLWGMFAVALWDTVDRRLYLARDRFGKKPLYVGRCGTTLLFGSELKALSAYPAFDTGIDRRALAAFLRFAYVPDDRSIYTGVRKVPPGCVVEFDAPDAEPRVVRYWSAVDAAHRGVLERPAARDPREAENELDSLLRDAVRRRMVADVPLGAFLSGGIDSSVVTALMAAQSSQPVRTFTMGFESDGYDEAAAARAVADVLGTQHTELRVTAAEARDVIPTLPHIFDEPFADSSQIPTLLVAQLARRHVTVALSGDGGDEVFGGYLRYQWLPATFQQGRNLPWPLRRLAARSLQLVRPATWDAALALIQPITPSRWGQVRPGEKLHKVGAILAAETLDEAYLSTVSIWQQPQRLVVGGADNGAYWDSAGMAERFHSPLDRLMATDAVTYLPGDILVKVDRATMAHSLEARAPLLDHRVYEWAWRQPPHLKLHEGRGKWLLRRVLARYVPPALFERPKMGFGVPVGDWLRGPLRDWAEALLDPVRLRREGYLSPKGITPVWQAHLRGRGSHAHRLWTVLMFQAWLEARR